MGDIFLYELLGTMLLVAIGTSVNAAVSTKKSYGNNSGWLVVAFGWGIGITIGAAVASKSGGSINPAMALINWIEGYYSVGDFFIAVLGEFVGAAIGALITTAIFWEQFKTVDNKETIRGIFATAPANEDRTIMVYGSSFFAEAMGTFVLGVALFLPFASSLDGIVSAMYAGMVVTGIGLSFGATTGFAINPARDLAPRLVYFLIPFKDKVGADWAYSWVPIAAPFVGGALAGGLVALL